MRGGLLESRSGVVVWSEEEGRVRLRLDEDWGQAALLTRIAGGSALGVAGTAEAEDEDEDKGARFDAAAAI